MGTVTITLNSAPLNGTKTYTIPDADVSILISWAENAYHVTTPAAALVAWCNAWMDYTTNIVQQGNTTVNVPPPISIT